MGLSSAIQWWEEWQLRVLVLGSLFIHFFLYFSDMVRRFPTLRKFRVLVWMAYVGSDALATLFNRHKLQGQADEGSRQGARLDLLLIHLGGQPWITAYSLEDNELWKRHVITLFSQVAVALYVVCKWWSGEKRLLAVAVLLFVVGILKFGQKPWALKRASFNGMLASAAAPPQTTSGPLGEWWRYWTRNAKHNHAPFKPEAARGVAFSLEDYVQQANKYRYRQPPQGEASTELSYVYLMFVDISATYTHRLHEMVSSLNLDDAWAYKVLQRDIRLMFQLLYTKLGTTTSLPGILQLFLLPCLILASVVIFAMSHKHGYDGTDVIVTYILLCSTALQELLLILSLFLFIPCPQVYGGIWHDMISQYNLLSFCARKKQPTILMKLATFNCLREYLNTHWYIWQEPAARRITTLVRRHVRRGWRRYILGDRARYMRFNDLRGQRALRRHVQLSWSLSKSFDESVILWHIATDLCFHYTNINTPSPRGVATQNASQISNYLIYLLSTQPEMLMPGSRPALLTIASRYITESLDLDTPFDREENLAQRIISGIGAAALDPSAYFVHEACMVAKKLMELDDNERWTVIQGVWVEMLCYSASKCRGYLHAKSLGEGGEYLTTVWLHWSLMGMENLADRLQRPEPYPEEEYEEEIEEGEAEAAGAVVIQ